MLISIYYLARVFTMFSPEVEVVVQVLSPLSEMFLPADIVESYTVPFNGMSLEVNVEFINSSATWMSPRTFTGPTFFCTCLGWKSTVPGTLDA